MIQVSSAQ